MASRPPVSRLRRARRARACTRRDAGEEHVARSLAQRLSDEVVVLHDRRPADGRGAVDHLVVAPTGVWVVDTTSSEAKVAVDRQGRLTIAGQDRSELVAAVREQHAAVRAVVDEVDPGAPVHAVLCLVDAEFPLLRTLAVGGVAVLSPIALTKRVDAPGPLDRRRIEAIAAALMARFPVA